LSNPTAYDWVKNKRLDMNMNKTDQLELGLSGQPQFSVVSRPPQRRLSRAQWWFAQMRQIVDRAMDWQPAPAPRPEQIWFPGTHRPAQV
jgi:hypothetical protein